MLKVNYRIKIFPSKELRKIKLDGLIVKTGVIVEDLNYAGRKNKGFLVKLDNEFIGEYTWYVPFESCSHVE